MKHKLFSGHVRYMVVILAGLLLFCSGEVFAKPYCVSDVGELQDALFFAAENGQDDVIKIVQGTYTDTFIFSSTEEHSLTLLGGYTPVCFASPQSRQHHSGRGQQRAGAGPQVQPSNYI